MMKHSSSLCLLFLLALCTTLLACGLVQAQVLFQVRVRRVYMYLYTSIMLWSTYHACHDDLCARVQGFNWESCKQQGGWYNRLKTQVDDIARAGVTHVWLPPPSHSVSPQGTLTARPTPSR